MKEPFTIRAGENESFNIVTLYGEIKAESINAVSDIILKSRPGPFVVHVNSTGGAVIEGRGLVELLNSFDVPVTWISRGYNASMGCNIPHLGDGLRLCYKGTQFMYHSRTLSLHGSIDEIDQKLGLTSTEAEISDAIIYKAIGLTKREYKRYNGSDYRVNAETALTVGKHGMVDGIIMKDYRNGEFDIMTRHGKKYISVLKHRRADLANLPVIL